MPELLSTNCRHVSPQHSWGVREDNDTRRPCKEQAVKASTSKWHTPQNKNPQTAGMSASTLGEQERRMAPQGPCEERAAKDKHKQAAHTTEQGLRNAAGKPLHVAHNHHPAAGLELRKKSPFQLRGHS
eukprot:scaffold23464_cov19-Tisochrysis_lutea.AAC.1